MDDGDVPLTIDESFKNDDEEEETPIAEPSPIKQQ